MTKNNARAKAARAHQAEHPDLTYTAALRAVDTTSPPSTIPGGDPDPQPCPPPYFTLEDIVGSTGSGKTGLSKRILQDAPTDPATRIILTLGDEYRDLANILGAHVIDLGKVSVDFTDLTRDKVVQRLDETLNHPRVTPGQTMIVKGARVAKNIPPELRSVEELPTVLAFDLLTLMMGNLPVGTRVTVVSDPWLGPEWSDVAVSWRRSARQSGRSIILRRILAEPDMGMPRPDGVYVGYRTLAGRTDWSPTARIVAQNLLVEAGLPVDEDRLEALTHRLLTLDVGAFISADTLLSEV